jgi:ABC-2 type transport system permease protein
VSEAGGSVSGAFVSVKATEELTMFDIMVPGVMVFGLMMQAIGVTLTMGTEVKNRTLHRLRLTKMTAFDLLGGTTIRWMALGALQVVIFFLVAMGLGVNMAGDLWITVPTAILIALVVVLATLSLGLIISAYVDDPEQATNLSFLVVMPMAFFTGAFFPVDFAFASVLPWTQGANALNKAMLYADIGDAMIHTGYCLMGALVLFAAGVIVFSRHRLRN